MFSLNLETPLPLSWLAVRPVTRIQAHRPSTSIAVVPSNSGQLRVELAKFCAPANPRAPGAKVESGDNCRSCAE